MLFNNLLEEENIDQSGVLVLRHTPKEPALKETLPLLAAVKPDLFNAYQQTQDVKVEAEMLRAKHVASFIGLPKRPGNAGHAAVFVGLYKVGRHRPLTVEEFWEVPALQEMRTSFKLRGFQDGDRPSIGGKPASVLWFNLTLTDFYKKWQGKLIIDWPPPPIKFSRFAHKNNFPIHSILEESALHEAMPEWNKCIVPWAKLSILPNSWRQKLSQWRGIYYIHDHSDGTGYVGSAYGDVGSAKGDDINILGRWDVHAKTGGDSVRLRERSPKNFTFSILELVSPNMQKDDVLALEATWKNRLHTHWPSGLNEN
jgi:hypothetical protein